jgi:hypothetical protein
VPVSLRVIVVRVDDDFAGRPPSPPRSALPHAPSDQAP